MLRQSLDPKILIWGIYSQKINCCLKILTMTLGCHWSLQMILESKIKWNVVWTWAKWMFGCVHVYARDRFISTIEAQGSLGSRPSQLRTGLRAFLYYALSDYHMSCMGRTWLINLQRFTVVVSSGCVGVFYDLLLCIPTWRKRGPEPCWFLSKEGETLARRDYGGMTHCKGLVTCSRLLT